MDDLTPMEPEYREIPPEPAVEDPYYYGTGRAPRKHRSHGAAILTVFILIFTANLLTVGMLLWMRDRVGTPSGLSGDNTEQTPTPSNGRQEVLTGTEEPVSSTEPDADATGSALSRAALYEKMAPSLVQISQGETSATGVVLTEDGYILTSAAALEGSTQPVVTLSDGSSHKAQQVGSDSSSDLAVLKIEVSGLSPADFDAGTALKAGDTAYAFSFPFGGQMQATMTEGFVSSVGAVEISGTQLQVLQTNAALEGVSAGPIVNVYGQVVAFQVERVGDYVSYETVSGIGFALPMDAAGPIISQLMNYGYVTGRASLGVEVAELSEAQRLYWDLPRGVIISEIRTDSAAFLAGLRAGDVLISIGDTAVTEEASYYSALNGVQAGQRVRVVIYRRGAQLYADITLDEATE
ncbi:MAG: trypsin-like peptidase domain-containing protein [Oscillospiraceae bacterium]|nr:trypsin-like peptidase domain-containing protein [Oscillospiraceae bacterium]